MFGCIQHKSDDKSGDDTAIWEAMSVQSKSFSVGKGVFMYRNMKDLLRAVDQYPKRCPVLWLPLSLNDHHTSPCRNNQQNLEYYI